MDSLLRHSGVLSVLEYMCTEFVYVYIHVYNCKWNQAPTSGGGFILGGGGCIKWEVCNLQSRAVTEAHESMQSRYFFRFHFSFRNWSHSAGSGEQV